MKIKQMSVAARIVALMMVTTSVASAQDMKALERGEVDVKIYSVKGSDAPKAVVTAIIDAAPEKVWEIIRDCRHYNKRFDRVKTSKLIEQKDNTFTCEVEIELPFPFSNLVGVTKATHTVEAGKSWKRAWTLVRGDYHVNDGSWELKPYGDGTRTLAIYKIHADPKNAVPDWLRNKAQKSTLPDMITRLRKEVKKLP
jgi:ribosome-associated toxin RatA of RatAB toxin-antitoxin module